MPSPVCDPAVPRLPAGTVSPGSAAVGRLPAGRRGGTYCRRLHDHEAAQEDDAPAAHGGHTRLPAGPARRGSRGDHWNVYFDDHTSQRVFCVGSTLLCCDM